MIKKISITTLLILLFCLRIFAQQMIIGTYNLRFDNKADTGNLWVQRAPVIASLIRFHQYDIFGTQEGYLNQLNDLSSALPEYARYGIGRDDGKDGGEHSAIFYRKDKFKLLKKGDFWLSETPDKPGLGWDVTCCNRICSWVYLQDQKSGRKFYYFNAHYDYQGNARLESSKLILRKIKEIAGTEPAVFTGDLNGEHETEWYRLLAKSGFLRDTYNLVKHPYANNTSFNGFGKEVSGSGIIDHVFVTKDFTASRWGILTDTYHGKYPSDHCPILTEVTLK
ncbi:endonuclease/exonuclease/phosphatase family protein [Pedobacter sp. L105]|uniref:endonuclease/exonuclease/phosphatase family protein n=1 Tax=Pedobacter sp. L105 TaxID=1641871 RepID=UPI001576BF53|nr:endonuclease/exonuclease/phosphatase family protein [Pedobacter sp. L105]